MPPDDRDGLERLARTLLRPPVSLEQLLLDEHAQTIAYAARPKLGLQGHTATTPVDPNEFLARVVMHIPEPRVITKILRHRATKAADQRSLPQASTAAA